MNRLRLFIENVEVELDENVTFAITKQFEDITNPTSIINDWSKTIKIPFTTSNNKLFGHIYCQDRVISAGTDSSLTGLRFDPTKKLDFRIEYCSDVIMTGYAKLNTITKQNGFGSYNITLNGQLGKIFQELSKITFNLNEDTDEKYKINGAQYVSTKIDKNLVADSWASAGQSTLDLRNSSILDIIGFAPNNSFNDGFEYSTFQLSKNSCKTFTEVLNAQTDWQALGINAESVIPNGMTPRGIGEFRSYYQIPFIYFNKLFQIFQEKGEEITGYRFVLDSSWFNSSNDYWSKLVYMLKSFNDSIKNGEIKNNIYGSDLFRNASHTWSDSRANYTTHINLNNILDETGSITEQVPMYRQYPSYWTFYDIPDGYDNIAIRKIMNFNFSWVADGTFQTNNAMVMIVTMYGGSDPDNAVPVSTCKFLIKAPGCTITEPGAIDVVVNGSMASYRLPFSVECAFKVSKSIAGNMFSFGTECYWVNNNQPFKRSGSAIQGDISCILSSGSMNFNLYNGFFRSGANFILNDLWNNEYNLFTEILNYCKMYKILIIADNNKKLLKFIPATTYFADYTIEDWTDKVDISKDYVIKPITFENKYVLFNYKDSDTKFGAAYKEKYGFNYGEKNITTEYNFNDEIKSLFNHEITQSLTNTDNTISWNNLYTEHIILYSLPSEVFIYSKDDSDKFKECFGAYYFHRGLANFDTEPRLKMRPVYITDDTVYQQAISTFFYAQNLDEGIHSTTYPNLDVVNNNKLCIFNTPNEIYTYDKNKFNNVLSLYDGIWDMYLNERYNIQNKLITCYIDIKITDFSNFKFNKFVKIGNQLCMVNKIFDYEFSDNATTKVELITINNINSYYQNKLA